MFKKFLSRKFLVVMIIDVLVIVGVISGTIAPELKELALKLLVGANSLYVVVEAILDIFRKKEFEDQ